MESFFCTAEILLSCDQVFPVIVSTEPNQMKN